MPPHNDGLPQAACFAVTVVTVEQHSAISNQPSYRGIGDPDLNHWQVATMNLSGCSMAEC